MKILFMGTPEFALYSLQAIFDSGEEIVGVVTQSDKPKGRRMVMTSSPVKLFAVEKNIPVYQPATLRDGAFECTLKELQPELIVVVAYGKILPQYVLDYPAYGCINAHGSLLPKYRGAAPIQRAIMNGEKITGVTAMYMDIGIDTGDMINTETVEISDSDNFETVHDKMAIAGAKSLLRAIDSIKDGTVERIKQDDSLATYVEKIERDDCVLDFSRDAVSLFNHIRGLSPIPLSFTNTPDGKILKVVSSEVISISASDNESGTVISLDNGIISVACGNGILGITEVIPEGKKKMASSDFIRGRKINVGDKLL